MEKVVIQHGFRFEGKFYAASRKTRNLSKRVTTFALSHGLATKPRVTKNKMLKVREVK